MRGHVGVVRGQTRGRHVGRQGVRHALWNALGCGHDCAHPLGAPHRHGGRVMQLLVVLRLHVQLLLPHHLLLPRPQALPLVLRCLLSLCPTLLQAPGPPDWQASRRARPARSNRH